MVRWNFEPSARGPQHEGTLEISPSVGYLHRAWEESAAGSMSSQPFMEVFLQTAVDPVLAPNGRHVASAFTQYAPASGALDRAGALETVLRILGNEVSVATVVLVALLLTFGSQFTLFAMWFDMESNKDLK